MREKVNKQIKSVTILSQFDPFDILLTHYTFVCTKESIAELKHLFLFVYSFQINRQDQILKKINE